MTKTLKKKLADALKAIEDVHNDTSGPATDNLEAMREIGSKADIFESALAEDCEAD